MLDEAELPPVPDDALEDDDVPVLDDEDDALLLELDVLPALELDDALEVLPALVLDDEPVEPVDAALAVDAPELPLLDELLLQAAKPTTKISTPLRTMHPSRIGAS